MLLEDLICHPQLNATGDIKHQLVIFCWQNQRALYHSSKTIETASSYCWKFHAGMHSIVKKVFLLVHGLSSVCHDFLNVEKAGIEEALQIREHFTTALSNYYCHIMYFSLRLPISLSSSLCPFFLFLWNTKNLHSSFCVHLCFFFNPAASVHSQVRLSCLLYKLIFSELVSVLLYALEHASHFRSTSWGWGKFLSVILRCEKWFTHSVTGPINRFCP